MCIRCARLLATQQTPLGDVDLTMKMIQKKRKPAYVRDAHASMRTM